MMTEEEEYELERSTGAVAYYAKQRYYCQQRGMHSYPGFSQLPPIEREAWQYVADTLAARKLEP